MNKCLLCKEKDANKTGSHIIPSFLMKRINGGGKRDHEVGFVIKNGISFPYFGRDIYEDKRRTITDNEDLIYSRDNYDVKDYILCKSCEDYFSLLESKYAPSLNLNFSADSNAINTKVSPSNALLFWCSIIWRVSVTEHFGCRLRQDLEERVRLALVNDSVEGLNVHYALFRCKDYSKTSEIGTFVCMDTRDNGVLIFVDDFMLAMIFDLNEDEYAVELLEIKLKLKRDKLNTGEKYEEIAPIPNNVFTQLMQSFIHMVIRNMQIPENFQKMHELIFKNQIPNEVLYDIFNIMQSTGKLGDKYTVEHYSWCYKEALKKHGLIVENEDGTYTIIKTRC